MCVCVCVRGKGEVFGLTTPTDIVADVKEECSKYGPVLDIKVPRPSMGSRQSAGVGKIFIKYDSPASAHKALAALAGRKFADRTVVTTYFSEVCSGRRLNDGMARC